MTDNSDHAMRDEIDLADVWLMVARHKVGFFSALLICVLAGMATYFLLPPRYEHKLMLEVGGVWTGPGLDGAIATTGTFEYIEMPEVVKIKVEEHFTEEVIANVRQDLETESVPDEVGVTVPEGTGIVQIQITAQLSSETAANSVLEGIATRVLASHNELLARRVEVLSRITADQLRELDQRIRLLQASRDNVVKNGSVESKGIALLMIDTNIQELMLERSELERELEVGLTLNTRETRVIAGPGREQNPVGPELLLSLMLSALIGVFIGFMVVMFLNVRKKADVRARGLRS